jgi:hypothetical protein
MALRKLQQILRQQPLQKRHPIGSANRQQPIPIAEVGGKTEWRYCFRANQMSGYHHRCWSKKHHGAIMKGKRPQCKQWPFLLCESIAILGCALGSLVAGIWLPLHNDVAMLKSSHDR